MTFWRTVFKKQRSDANKTNQNNLTNKEQKEFSLKSNEIWEQLETLWEARKQITDPDAFYNWYIDLSSLFLAKSKEWKPPPSEKKIEKMFKFENKSKKKSKFSRKKKSVKSPWENLQELQDYSKLREFQISQAKDPKFSFILENISQPFEFIIDTLHVAYVLLDKLKKAFVISKGQSFSIPFNLINLSTSLEVLSILSRSKINQQIMIRFGLIHELKSIANVSLQFYSLISQTDVSLYSPDKTLTLVQIQNMLYFQFLQLNLLIIISNISNIPLLELSIEYLEKIANTKLTIDFEFLSQLEAVELLKDLFQKSIELSRFYINEWQHLIHINFLNLIMNSIRSRKFINNFNEKLLENGFSAFMQFRQPKKILSFPISFLDEKEFSFLNIMKLWQEQSQNQIQEESGMSMNEKKDIIKIFKYINSILFLIHVSEFIENDNYFVEQFVCNHPRIMELSNFTLWISFKFLPDDINRLMKENKQVLNEKVEKKAQHYCSPKINSIDNCFRLIKNAVEKNYFGNEKRIPLPKNVEFKDFFVMQNISTHLVQETKIDHEFESNNHLRYLFQILLKISRNSHTQTAENNEKKQENIPIRDRIIENLLNIFRIEDNQKVLKYRNIIHNLWPQLQLEILSLLMQILDQNVLDKLKEKKYWSIFFSSYFIPEINSTFIATKESTQLFSIVNDLLMKIIYEAGYKEQTSNIEECGILVEFLEYNRHNLNIIGQVMTAIFGILERKYKMAVSSLTTIKIIPVVTGIIHETFWYQIGLKQDGEEDEKKQNMEIETVQVPVARYNQYTREYSLEKLFQVRLQMFDFINLFLSNKAHRKLMVENFGNELTSILLTLLLEKETRDFSLQHLSFNLGTTPSKQPPNIWKEMGTNILRFVRVLFEEETKRKKKKDDQITDIQGDLEKESLIELMKDVMTMVSDCITNHQEILQYMLMDIGVFQFVMELLKEPETANKLFVEIMHLLIELFRGSDPTVVEKFEKEIGHDELRKAIWECQMKKQTEIAFQLLLEMLVNNNYSQQKQAPIRSQESRNSFGIQRLFDCERNYIIQNRHVVMVMFRLFTQGDPHPDLPLFLNLLDTFTIICERSLHNTSCCCEVGLVGFLVDLIPHVWGSNSRFSDSLQNVEEEQILQKIRNQTVRLLGGIGSHRITVKELKNIFSLLQSVDGLARPSFSPLVLSALYKMLRNKDRDDNVQPSAFFDFDGRSASLEIPFISEWPAVKGMTFCTWIRIESLQDPLNKPDYEPRIFSFMNKNGRGIELYFRNDNESDQNYLGMTLTTSIEEERDQSQEINSNTKINNYINKNIKTDGAIQIETESNMKNINVNVNVNANVNVNNANADVNFNSNTETSKNNSETKEQKRRKSSAKVIDEKLKQQLKSKRQIPIGWKQQPLQPQNEGAGDISSQKEQVIERDVLLIIRVVFANCSDFAVFPIRIPIKRWFCLGLTHSQSRWTSSGEARVYLNGESGGSRAGLKFSQFGGGFTHNRIGSNFGFSEPEENEAILGRSKRENPFCGQMGAIYFFDEALTASQLRDIYQLGASYAGNFEAVANPQSGRVQTSPHISQSGVLDGSLSSKIFLSLNSRACSLHHCFDQSSRGVVDKLRIVSMFNCISRNLADIVGCVGGVRALFPLFAQLDQPEATPQNLIALRNSRKSSISNSTILTDTTNLTDSKNLADSTNLNNSNNSKNLADSTNNLIDSKNDSNNLIDSKNNSTNNLNDSNILIDSKNDSNNLIDSKNNSNNLIDSKNNSFVIKNSFRIKETPLTKNSPQNKSQIDFSINPNLSGQIFDLIAKMLILNNANVQDIVNRRGISVLGYLFRTISPQHMSIEIVKTIKKLLFQVENTQLSHDIIHSLVFNYDIWIYSRYEVQERLISDILLKSLLQERKKLPVYFEMNCRPLFLILRSYYWMKPDKFSKAGEPKRSTETQEIIGKRPEIEQMVTLRASILECVYRVLLIFPTEANFSQLIHYCLEMTQQRRTEEIRDVLDMVVKILSAMRTEKPGLSQITLQNENQDSGDEIQENDLRSKILDMFNECGYADPFMLIMDTKDAVVREQCLEIICDLEWQHDQHPRKKLNSRICSENGYDMFHGQAIKYSLSVRSANLLFCMLLGRHPGSVLIDISPPQLVISENEDNSTFALTHLAEAFMIKKICVLETIGEALAKEGKTELARAIIQRFENIVTNSFVNQCAFSKFSNWERWFIPLLDPITSADQMRQKPKLTNIEPISRLPVLLLKDLNTSVFGIFSEIWGYLFQNEKGGWRLFDQSVKLALSMQYRKLSHEHALLSRMFSVAIDSFLKIMYTKYVNQSFLFVRAHFKESTTFFDNLLHFVILCNDFLVFVPTAINIPRIPSPIIRSRNLFGMGNEDDEKSPVVENEQNAREIVSEHKKEPTQTGPHVLSRPYGDVTFSYSLRIQDNKWKDTTLVLKLISFLDQFDFFNIQTASSVFVDKHLASTTLCNLALLLVSGITRLKGIETKWFVEKLVKFVSNVESQTANIKTRDRNIILIILSHLFEASENEQKSRQNSNTSDSNTDQDRPLQVAQSIMKKTYSILVPLMKDNSGRTLLPKKRAGSIIFHKSQDELREMFFGNTEWKDAIQNSFHSEAEKHRKQLDLQSTNTASEMRERLRDVEISQKKYLIQKVSSFENLLQKFRLDWFSSFKSFINEQIISSAAKRERKMILSMDQWRRTLRSLASERGPWGARKTLFESTFWKLDKTEDNERRRRKMKQNYHFSNHFDASVRRDQSSKEMADKIITQNYDKIQLQKLSSQPNNDTQHLHLLDIQRHTSDIPEEDPDALPDQNDDSEPTNSNKLVFQANSFLVKPQSSTSGMFEITRSEIHFYPGKSAPQENHKRPTTPTESSDISPPNNTSHGDIQKDRTWRLKDLKSIFKKRFKMKNSALEFYFTDRTSYFFDFTPKTRNIIFRKINALKPPNLIRVDTGAPTEWLRKTNLTKRWQRYQITNFDYLVELNFLAGRSYNDLSQYPVFPWILSDYDSDKLDLQNPNSFRDLSKPIGSINENNLQQCIARYQTFEKANTGVPPFYYGSHYSTPAVVLHYLVRLEPFTTLFIDFQSGRFDSSDRMFHSVSELWKSCTGTTSDVRELIPEFFYFPEFLENSNRFDLGKRQNETQVDHVVLPNWATSPEDFIHKHRSALECEYVSQHIHEWIDLIFGFKQRGEEAIKAYNVFYYLTYPDSVDIDLIQNQTEKESIEMQIQNFGQTPTQVFKKPHPHRLSFAEQQNIHPLYWKITRFSSVVSNIIKITDSPILFIANSSRLVIFDAQRNLTTYRWCSTNPVVNSSENSTTSFAINKDENNPPKNNEIIPQINEQIKPSIQQSQSQQNSLIELDSAMKNTRRKVGVSFSFMLPKNNRRFAISTNEKIIFSCGYWDNSFKLNQLDTTKLVQSIEYHKDVVTCLSFHKNTLVTGSRDTTVAVWRFSSKTNTVNEKPRHVLFGHDDNVTCVDVNEDLDIIISASQDGSCIMHTLRRGRYVRTIRVDPQTDVPISSVYITAVGDVIIYCEKSSTLWLFSINGKNLLSIRLNSSVRSFLFTQNGDFAFCGMENGAIHILRISDLKIIQSLFFHSPVLSLSFSQDEKQIVAGFADGMLLILFFMKN